MHTINTTTQFTQALINDTDLLTQLVEAPKLSPDQYIFGVDGVTDAKLMPSCVRTAYTAVLGAALRENGRTAPLYDEEAEQPNCYDPKTDGLSPDTPQTYEEAQLAASAVYRRAISQSKHEEGGWLTSMNKKSILKDANTGEYSVSVTTEHILKPFDGWLTDELARTPAEEDNSWFASLVYAKQLGVSVPAWAEGANAADQAFNDWLNQLPWNRDGLEITRRERIVGRCADRKWAELKQATLTKNHKALAKALNNWSLLVHSPKLAMDMALVTSSKLYKLHLVQTAQQSQLEELERLEFDQLIADTMADIKATTKAIKDRKDALSIKLGLTQPKAPKNKKVTEVLKAKAPAKGFKLNTINSRRAA